MFTSSRRAGLRLFARRYTTKPSEYGQPTPMSHPHLINRDQLTPGIPFSDYENRRRALMESLPNGSLVISVSAPVKYMSGNIFYKYRQASDFWYLTGFEEPNSAVILAKDGSQRGYNMTLFCAGRQSSVEQWDGANTSFDNAREIFQADEVLPITTFNERVQALTPDAERVFIDIPTSPPGPKWMLKTTGTRRDEAIEGISRHVRRPLAPLVGKLRAIKSYSEQQVMQHAATISGRAHARTMRFTQPGRSEGALAAHFEYLCALGGSQRPAYVPVVGSGPNSLILHYTKNNQIIQDGELVLMDAGCEYNGYASDITRTFPVNGTFSPAQHDLYSAVLSAQKRLIDLCTEAHGLTMEELHQKSTNMLREGLNRIGFNIDYHDHNIMKMLYPHYLSHPIGVDLHESALIDRWRPLQAGMVITIEPGIYVPPDDRFPKFYHNMGVRIEDEVLVGEAYPTVLSASAPKEIVDVEGACQGLLDLQAL